MFGGISATISVIIKTLKMFGILFKFLPISKIVNNPEDDFVILGPKVGRVTEHIEMIS